MNEKYEFIDGEKENFPVAKMRAWIAVSKSGFYDWRSRPLSATAERREKLKILIQNVFEESDGTHGYRRVHAALARRGMQAGPELIRALIRELGLAPCQPTPWRVTTIADEHAEQTPDLMHRDFTADAPGQKLVGDITYVHTWAGFLYLATVIDWSWLTRSRSRWACTA